MLEQKQHEAFDSPARYILTYGEKGSGKTIGLLHKLVRHCYENYNALGLILVRVKSMATKGGAWDKLTNHVLPRWKDGNRDEEGNLIDDGLGIEYSDVKFDSQHNEYLWIENMHGGWSMVVLVSAPHANQLRDRMRGYEPSIALVDELTSCDSIEYLRAVAIQVGRREGIEGPQQYMAACNPEGPSHWVYKAWFEEAFNPVTGEWDPDYHKIHIPIDQNRKHLPRGYVENLEKLYRNDPVEAARMLKGEWIDRPSGEALFNVLWNPQIHVRPTLPTLDRLLPVPKYPLIVGMDPGSANNAFIFMQWVPQDKGMTWLVVDEMVYVQRRIRYGQLVRALARRLQWWNNVMSHKFQVVYVSDNSAFNQYRAAGGSYDVLDMQKVMNEAPAGGEPLYKQLGLQPMRVGAAPKFSGSVLARTRLVMDLLGSEQLMVSAGCQAIIAMFNQLESENQKPGTHDPELALTPKRSKHLHPYDAMCNPILTASLQPALLAPRTERTQEFL
ncbi:MAG: phage terminase large subunit [Pseudomonadales bacterium]